MPNPWDPLPQPSKGDDLPATTYEWMGRVIAQWEHIEFQLGLLYSVFAGRPYQSDTIREYGEGKIFSQRLAKLLHQSNRYFVINCNQTLEGQFQSIRIAAEGFAHRRNEVAHAIVYPSVFLKSFVEDRVTGAERWALVPPHFAIRNFDASGFPTYAYTSRELNELVNRLGVLHKAIETFRDRLMGVAKACE